MSGPVPGQARNAESPRASRSLVGCGRWPVLAWLACAAILVHNAEEWVTMAATYQRMAPLLDRVGAGQTTSMGGFRTVNVAVSLLAVVLVVVGTIRTERHPAGRPLLVALTAATMLLNVFLPHVPAAIVQGGYVSGLVSAVLLVGPACAGLLWCLHRERMVDRRQLVRLFAAGVGLIALVLPVSLAVAGQLTGS